MISKLRKKTWRVISLALIALLLLAYVYEKIERFINSPETIETTINNTNNEQDYTKME